MKKSEIVGWLGVVDEAVEELQEWRRAQDDKPTWEEILNGLQKVRAEQGEQEEKAAPEHHYAGRLYGVNIWTSSKVEADKLAQYVSGYLHKPAPKVETKDGSLRFITNNMAYIPEADCGSPAYARVLTANQAIVLRDLRDRIRGGFSGPNLITPRAMQSLLDECLEVLDQIYGEQA